MTAARRREAASRKHNNLAPLLPPPPPRRFGQELVETSDLSVRRPYSELRPCRAPRAAPGPKGCQAARSGCVEHAKRQALATGASHACVLILGCFVVIIVF